MSCNGNCADCYIGCISGCNVTCLHKQNFCGGHCHGESQSADFYFDFTKGTFSRDTIIKKGFPSSTLDSWGEYLEKAYYKGDDVEGWTGYEQGEWTWKGADTPFLKASDIQEIVDAINGLGVEGQLPGNSASFGQERDDIIYGSLLEDIQTALENLQLNYDACDRCNSNCDNPGSYKCNSCQKCVECNNETSWSGSY